MRITLTILILIVSIATNAQNKEVEAIKSQATKFSKYLISGDRDKVVAMYTKDAKIFPEDTDILEGKELSNYWNPADKERKWKTTHHKFIPTEIKVWENEAYDFGYYEGTSSYGEQTYNWRGKYVVIWRKVDGVWKIYLDIWNRIKEED
ncbi:YybH family protein [Ekhidna sp.]|uniref:YybH family protein n=1 Tax=Ekhidna sp. TaxID=2608089 RepID=UPI003B50DD61